MQAYSNLGNTLKTLGDAADAICQYRRALEIAPDYVEAYFNLAITLKEQGQIDEALAAYREALRVRPNFFEARFNLGNLFKTQGLLPEAREAFEVVIRQRPDFAEAHHQLAGVLRSQGETPGAEAAYREAIRIKPAFVEAHVALANLLRDQGSFDAAIASYHEALRHQPNALEALNNLAIALRACGRLTEASDYCQKVLALNPECAEAHSNLGLVRHDQGLSAEALSSLREAIRLRPDLAAAHNALGVALETQGEHDEAQACFREAVRLSPQLAAAYNNLGGTLRSLGKIGEAIVCFEEALRLNAHLAEAHNGLGTALFENQQHEDAQAAFERALQLKPDYAEAHGNIGRLLGERGEHDAALERYNRAAIANPDSYSARHNRALVWLLMGNFSQGWPEYEWRWQQPGVRQRPSGEAWDGQPLAGRTILLYPEQGLGDTLQFIRYAPLVRQRGGRVLVGCSRSMIPLLSSCPGIDQLYGEDESPPPYDVQAALLSLPRIFGTELETIPAEVPYLSAPVDLVERWRERFAAEPRLKVGIQWQGSPKFVFDRQRSIPLARFAPLTEVDGVRLFSLQRDFGSEQLTDVDWDIEDLGSNLDLDGRAFLETAAVLKNLDLVVTSDTSIAHLAGALGVPVWLAVQFVPDWRWMLEREDSPWYPTMRLFRQTQAGDWQGVFARIATELAKVAAERAVPRGTQRV